MNQAFGGLSPTGQLDGPTVELMKRPRCGVKDIIGKASGSRRKRFALQGMAGWALRSGSVCELMTGCDVAAVATHPSVSGV